MLDSGLDKQKSNLKKSQAAYLDYRSGGGGVGSYLMSSSWHMVSCVDTLRNRQTDFDDHFICVVLNTRAQIDQSAAVFSDTR
jgi:hypothetical protein